MSGGCSLILVDRLWQNSGIVTATLGIQSINGMSTLPARDILGSTGGKGLMLAAYVWSTTGNNAAITNMTAQYTNDAGTVNRTATCQSFPATCVQGSIIPFTLQAGDTGISAVNGITLGTTLSIGNVSLAIFRPVSIISVPGNPSNTAFPGSVWYDAVSLGLPKLYDNSVLELWNIMGGNAAPNVYGQLRFAEG
jgi:hypothetical protein